MDYNSILKKQGLKVTKGRVAILNILFENKDIDITAEFIYERCIKKGVDINQSTVYRTIEMFIEKDLIDKFPLKEGVFSYKLKGKVHKYLIRCLVCHKEVEIPCPMKQVEVLVERETGFTLTEHALLLEGVCKDCRKRKIGTTKK